MHIYKEEADVWTGFGSGFLLIYCGGEAYLIFAAVHGAAGSYFMFCKGFAILSICSDCSIQQGDNCTVFCMVLLLVASDITMEQNEA
ncbi:uncharacterized protein DS421_2g44650 [Arachis hypogaea]|nr:uncharacterized protein DS421_2g44650 [Arachis hypogaea]